MSKYIPDSIMNLILDEIATADRIDVVSDISTPTNLSNSLAHTTLSSGDFTQAVGDSGSGSRKITIAAKTGVSVTNSGTPNHVVLTKNSGATIILITTCAGPDLTSGSTTDFPAWEYELVVPE